MGLQKTLALTIAERMGSQWALHNASEQTDPLNALPTSSSVNGVSVNPLQLIQINLSRGLFMIRSSENSDGYH